MGDNQICTVNLSNISFFATENDLEREFKKFGKVTSVRIYKNENGLSKGNGFVEFQSRKDAETASKKAQTIILNGRPLNAKFVNRPIIVQKSPSTAGLKESQSIGSISNLSHESPIRRDRSSDFREPSPVRNPRYSGPYIDDRRKSPSPRSRDYYDDRYRRDPRDSRDRDRDIRDRERERDRDRDIRDREMRERERSRGRESSPRRSRDRDDRDRRHDSRR